ncbi:signal peptidase II [Propionibacteriaceae bacterium G1746]|uniref:signal peptidase II n=1 Tax=Aestuariimicrobium sp. G57 TaxID=3418485 RepID=UPI003C266F55
MVWGALVAVFVVGYAIDQVTKALAVRHLDPADPPSYLGGLLTLRLIRNPGAAFSMGAAFTEVLSVLAIAALVFCAVWLAPRVRTVAQGAVLGLAMAGIAGNLTDRLLRAPGPLRGHVIDFFSVPNFAIFNVADICLTTAAGIVIIWSLLEGRREKAARTPGA